MPNSTLTFHNTRFNVIDRNGQSWLTSAEIAQALEYADSKAVSNLYASNSDEFSCQMTTVVDSTTITGNKPTRIFSLRGAHLIGMFARTPIAKEFRQWILDVLDKEVHSPKLGNEVQPYVYRFMYDGRAVRAIKRDGTLWFLAEDLRLVFCYMTVYNLLKGIALEDISTAVIDGLEQQVVNVCGAQAICDKRLRSNGGGRFRGWLADIIQSVPLAGVRPPLVDASLPVAENHVFSTQAVDCCYVPSLQKSLFQVKPGIDVVFALEEARSLVTGTREMLYNYPDHEQAANSAGYMMYFVEGLIESAHMSLRQAI